MPYVLDRNPCGSSSGSGVVAAADLAVAAVGTETDGSIVCPSGANGVVGIKPTLGLWSRAGVVPISADQDTAGPIARNVTDAAVLLGAATGVDPNDAATADQAGHAFTDYTQFLDDEALEGARIGVWRAGTYDPALVGPVVEPILADVIAALEDQGATVVDPTDIDLSATANEFPRPALRVQDRHRDVPPDLRPRNEPGLGPAVPADARRPDRVRPGPSRARRSVERRSSSSSPRRRTAATPIAPTCARRRRRPSRPRSTRSWPTNDLDAIIALTNGPAWPTNANPDEGDLDGHFEYFVGSSTAAAVSGYADITVPAGYDAGLPIGITFIGGRWAEPELIGFAYDYEQATQVRVPPQFIPTIGDALFPGVPNPRGSGAGAAAAGDPGSARSRRALPVEAHLRNNEARPFGRASCRLSGAAL